MKNFFGVTLGEDFLLTLSNLENAFRSGTLSDDADNIQRIILLYKLRRSDRILEFIKTLVHRTDQIARAGRGGEKESRFLARLFRKLYQFSMEKQHLAAAEAIK